MYDCLFCGVNVKKRYPLCHKCYKDYPTPQWEEWFNELWKDEKKKRYRDDKVREREVSFSDCSYDEQKQVGILD